MHKSCHTVLEIEEKEQAEPSLTRPSVQVRKQPFCPKCQQWLKTDEISKTIEMTSGILTLSDTELESLKFESTKRIEAELIQANDPVLESIGFGRRLYVMPKAGALPEYSNIWYLLFRSQRLGFFPCLVIKEKPNVAVIKPLNIPEVVFGKPYQILVVDILNDTDCLKSPTELPDSFSELLPFDASRLTQPIVAAQEIETTLGPERCINPKRRRLREIARQVLIRSL